MTMFSKMKSFSTCCEPDFLSFISEAALSPVDCNIVGPTNPRKKSYQTIIKSYQIYSASSITYTWYQTALIITCSFFSKEKFKLCVLKKKSLNVFKKLQTTNTERVNEGQRAPSARHQTDNTIGTSQSHMQIDSRVTAWHEINLFKFIYIYFWE